MELGTVTAIATIVGSLTQVVQALDKARGQKLPKVQVDQLVGTLVLARSQIEILKSMLETLEKKSTMEAKRADVADAKIAELEAEVSRLLSLVPDTKHEWIPLDLEIIASLAMTDGRSNGAGLTIQHLRVRERDLAVVGSRLDRLIAGQFITRQRRFDSTKYTLRPRGRQIYSDYIVPSSQHAQSEDDWIGATIRSLNGTDSE